MLYVFRVDTGTMKTFDMRYAMDSVMNLKKAIETQTGIPEDKQVLLISGGESLNNLQRICSYNSAGTDTCPIFLFAKIIQEPNQIQSPNLGTEDETDMTEMIEGCMSMQPNLDTLVARTELAAHLHEIAVDQKEVCERLVHDQHLQQQGWAAVTANLEDLSRAFKNKAEVLMLAFSEFIKCKPSHEELLSKFEEDIKHLDNIPILPALLENQKMNVDPSTASNPAASSQQAGASTSNLSKKVSDEIQRNQLGRKSSSKTSLACRQILQSSAKSKARPQESNLKLQSTLKTTDTQASSPPAAATTSHTSRGNTTTITTSETESTSPKSPSTLSCPTPSLVVKESREALNEATDTVQGGDNRSNKGADEGSTLGSHANAPEVGDGDFLDASTEAVNKSSSSDLRPPSIISDESLVSLRQWIDYHDNANSLERLIELCWRGLERFTEANAEQIKFEVQEILKVANDSNMKAIRGLEERLIGLEKLMVEARKVVDEQSQLAASFQSNKERFSKIKDSSLLPDLSASHKEQLQMMLTNHKRMSDYRTRCLKAKYELSANLLARLRWIMVIEQQICNMDGTLMIYKENLSRLNRHFEIVDQVHRSPELYLTAVTEALRRRRFTRRYLHWANSIAKISQELFESEMKAREGFESKMGNHFLTTLFPGMLKSYPPRFATVRPDPFDTKLPRVTAGDIQYLQATLCPELAEKLKIPRDVPLPHISGVPASQLLLDKNTGERVPGTTDDDDDDEDAVETDDFNDRHSLNPTPPSSPLR